ncbi:MAG: hypothetical protein RIM23_14015, partial [Coleofasciculus sp. G3-WIS-01]|uniref:hypothetical protein n=1 Tax=Coleofasciculus sp. G3-WIS-01 TaxID=3069528 RepID=UPI0032F89E5D
TLPQKWVKTGGATIPLHPERGMLLKPLPRVPPWSKDTGFPTTKDFYEPGSGDKGLKCHVS